MVSSSWTVVRGSWSLRVTSGAESVPSPWRKSSSTSSARVTAGTSRPMVVHHPLVFDIPASDRHHEHRLSVAHLRGNDEVMCGTRQPNRYVPFLPVCERMTWGRCHPAPPSPGLVDTVRARLPVRRGRAGYSLFHVFTELLFTSAATRRAAERPAPQRSGRVPEPGPAALARGRARAAAAQPQR